MQIELTPPRQGGLESPEEYCTPPKRTSYQTPPKRIIYETPRKQSSSNHTQETSNPKFNPESKAAHSPQITPFFLNRLDQDYQFIRQLGSGNFSSVGLYKSRTTSELVAIKIARASHMSVNEAQALGTLSIFAEKSKNIVRYFYCWAEEQALYLVMEYCQESLKSFFEGYKQRNAQMREAKAKEILRQALKGLSCLHRHQMVHLDIKPENLLLQDDLLKISDLGLVRSKRIRRQSELEEGDARYLAKEVLNYHEGIDLTKADIYSLGLTIYEGISQEVLPNNGEKWMRMRTEGLHLEDQMDLTNYSSELLETITKMTNPQWKLRPSADILLSSSYLAEKPLRRHNVFKSDKKTHERNIDASL